MGTSTPTAILPPSERPPTDGADGGRVEVGVELVKSVLCQRTWMLAACSPAFVPVMIVLTDCVLVTVIPLDVVVSTAK